MTDQDLEIFKKHFHLYECFKKHAFIRNYNKDVYTDLIYLYMKYISPTHSFSHWCSSCRAELVSYLYAWYTNEANSTWYTEDFPLPVADVPFTTEMPVIENKPIKRRRKPIK